MERLKARNNSDSTQLAYGLCGLFALLEHCEERDITILSRLITAKPEKHLAGMRKGKPFLNNISLPPGRTQGIPRTTSRLYLAQAHTPRRQGVEN